MNPEYMETEDLLRLHKNHAWQPFTQMKLAPDPLFIKKAQGVYLETDQGNKIIDAVGSWWVNIHGHNNPFINKALIDQLEKFEHVIYANFSHEKAAKLSAELSHTTNDVLSRVYFSDNGSTAVEIAMKMAAQYNYNMGNSKKMEFCALDRGYHGDTFGAMAAGERSVFHRAFENHLFSVTRVKAPQEPFEFQKSNSENDRFVSEALEDLELTLRKSDGKICAFIFEPLLQGASGMHIYPPQYLKKAREICDSFNVFMIADEVFTGFGRTGTLYACEQAGIWPDIMALSKGLSGGYLPFAATLATEEIFNGFNSENRNHTLFHGHSMTGNALGCAAALASLELMRKENRLADVKRIEIFHKERLKDLYLGPLMKKIHEIRFIGSVGVIEFDLDQGYTGEFGWKFQKKALERGVFLRTLGPVVYMAPPYIITDEELSIVYDVIEETAGELMV